MSGHQLAESMRAHDLHRQKAHRGVLGRANGRARIEPTSFLPARRDLRPDIHVSPHSRSIPMATAAFVFNISKGKVARYADLPDAADALILVWLKNSGLESDATLKDYANLSVLLAASNDECDFTGYTRRTLASVVSTPNNTSDLMASDAADPSSYTNTGTAQVAGAAIVCWDGDTGAGTDANIVPLCQLLVGTLTFDTNVATTAAFDAAGFYTAS